MSYQNFVSFYTFISYNFSPKSCAERFLSFNTAAFLYDVKELLRHIVENTLILLI